MSGTNIQSVGLMSGNGLVAYERGLSLVCAAPDEGTAGIVDGLLEAHAETVTGGGDGRMLIRRAAQALTAGLPAEPIACAVACPVERGVAVLVSGPATARVQVKDGDEVVLDGKDVLTWTDRVIDGPVTQLELALGDAGPVDSRLRLTAGVVPGGGLHLVAPDEGGITAPDSLQGPNETSYDPQAFPSYPAAEPAEEQAWPPAIPPQDEPARPEPSPVAAASPDLGRTAYDPAGAEPPAWNSGPEGGQPQAHAGPPATAVAQPAPSGVLLLEDGSTVPLDVGYLIGRDPSRAPEVESGEARPLRLTDQDGSISRRHARILLDGWDVKLVDLGSVNGTGIKEPGQQDFQRLAPETPATLTPGTTVLVGLSVTFRYELSHSS